MEKEAEKVLEDDKVVRRPEVSGTVIMAKYTVLIISMLVMLIPIELTPLPVRVFITIFTGILIVLDVEDVILSSQFLIYIGDISYALYLIHWPIYAYVKLTYPGNTWILTSALIISILLAMLVHQTYERWYLRQSNNMIAILVIILFSASAICINWDQIRENMDRTVNYALSSDRKYPRLDGWTPNMTLETLGCEPIAAPHIPVDNGRAFAKTWSPTCAKHLIMFVDFINTTQPDYAFIMSRFFAVAEPYNNGPDNLNNDTVYLEMKSQLKKMLPNIKKKLFILDSFPRVQTNRVGKIAEEMKKGNKTMEEINKSLYDPFHYERGRHRYAELVKNECGSKCELIDYVDAFWNKTMNAFQYFDSNGFTYFTSINHVSAHGLEHVRPIYNKICDGL
ncbi:unnamed protein product [Caenorhabditis nigoni]